jgi:DtxR family transcriptional regulator, Mn-dependent transcriptional regulator
MNKKLTHSIEDYLEMIYILSQENQSIRITDIAARMQVRKSSIVSAVKKLEQCGYVQHKPYGSIILTEAGIRQASEVYRKHIVLKTFFFEILGLPEEIAEKDACNFEHYISDQTVSAIVKLAEKLQEEKKNHLI